MVGRSKRILLTLLSGYVACQARETFTTVPVTTNTAITMDTGSVHWPESTTEPSTTGTAYIDPVTESTTGTAFFNEVTTLDESTARIIWPVCEGYFQILHLQDMSWSNTDFSAQMKTYMRNLTTKLSEKFGLYEIALATFVDKPIPYSGYPDNYCYREDVPFTTDAEDYIETFNRMPVLDGRDWPQSQFDAIKWGVLSRTLGWKLDPIVKGKLVIKVFLMATDSGPHVAGHLGPFPPGGKDCFTTDYPSEAELKEIIEAGDVIPFVVVPGAIHSYYSNMMRRVNRDAVTVKIEESVDVVVEHLFKLMTRMCEERGSVISV